MSELIYDWNALDVVAPLTQKPIRLNDETLRDGIQSPSAIDPPLDDQARADRPHGVAAHRGRGHRAAGCGAARARRRDRDRQAHPQAQAEARAELRRAHAGGRHRAGGRSPAARRPPGGGLHLHRQLADPPVRRGVGRRASVADLGGGHRLRGQGRAGRLLRHRGHDAQPPGDARPALPQRHRPRRARPVPLRHGGLGNAGRRAAVDSLDP